MSPKKNYLKFANAPQNQPMSIDLDKGEMYLSKSEGDPDGKIDIAKANSVSQTKAALTQARPKWLTDFFAQMDTVIQAASGGDGKKSPNLVNIDTNTGELAISPNMPKSDIKKVCSHLAWIYEAQYRQNKEILLWIGELILDYIARETHREITIEEAIEELGLLERNNGVKWKVKTLCKWPIVVQRIPAPIRQLPIPPTYLTEAALFSQPEDPMDKIKFNNARDAMLVAVAENPDGWSRSKFVGCMKELQEYFAVGLTRNEGIASLQSRLICYYRLQREAAMSSQAPKSFYANLGLDEKEVATWIYNIENELIVRGKLPEQPFDEIQKGDGLTPSARERILKAAAKKEAQNK